MRDTISQVKPLRPPKPPTVSADDVLDAVRELASVPSPRGAERDLAVRLAEWAGRRWPDLGWACDQVGTAGANLVASSSRGGSPELLLYSHLDTSLSGDPARDWPVTGLARPIAPVAVSGGAVGGFGLGVAKAAAGAAIIGYAAAATALRAAGRAHRLTLLLASAGTHRSPFDGPEHASGVDHHLRARSRPAAAVVAKSGPAGILLAEPGAMFVRVRVTSTYHPVLARESATPEGGLIAHLGIVIRVLEEWRHAHLAARAGADQRIAAEVGIGAVRGGLSGKPDLLPGLVELHLYLVTVPGDSADEIAADVRDRLAGTLAGCPVAVDAHLVHPAGATPPDAPIARHAAAAWLARHGTPAPPVTGWRGSTDGAALRAHGIPTVRLGPPVGRDPADPRRDIVAVADLVRFAQMYADIALRHAGIDAAPAIDTGPSYMP